MSTNPFNEFAGRLTTIFESYWVLCLPLVWLAGAIFVWTQASHASKIAPRQAQAEGTITSNQMQDHERYAYTFAANGRTFHARGSAINEAAVPGDKITVYYDGQNPSESALESFGDLAQTAFGQATGICSLAFAFEIALLVAVIYTRRHNAAR